MGLNINYTCESNWNAKNAYIKLTKTVIKNILEVNPEKD